MHRYRIINHCMASLALAAGAVSAQEVDLFKFKAAYNLHSDSNIFRLPDGSDFYSLTGRSSASERIGIANLGMSIQRAFGLQRVEADFNVVDYRHENFDRLNFTAFNYDLLWRWSLTPSFRGSLSTQRRDALGNYADLINTTLRNERVSLSTQFEGQYEIDGAWSVLGGLTQASQRNEQPTIGEDDSRSLSVHAGALRRFGSGSTVSYDIKSYTGRYLGRELSEATLLDNEFRQLNHQLRVSWAFTGKSTASFSLSHLDRSHSNFSQRDFRGWVGAAGFNWSLSEKASLAVGFAREQAAYQTSNTNFSQTERLSFAPLWKLSEKTTLKFRHGISRVGFGGSPAGVASSGRADTTNDTSMSVQWQATRQAIFSASLQRIRRSSNQAQFEFNSKQAHLGAQFSF